MTQIFFNTLVILIGVWYYCVVLGLLHTLTGPSYPQHTFFVAMYSSTSRRLTFRAGSAGNVGPFPAITPTISSHMLLAAKWLNGKNISTAYLAAMSSRTLREEGNKKGQRHL